MDNSKLYRAVFKREMPCIDTNNTQEIVKEIREAIRQIYDMSEVLDQIESDTSYGSIETHSE